MTYEQYADRSTFSNGHTKSADELERDLQKIRSEISQTLDEISQELHPKELLKRVLNSIGSGQGGTFVRNLGRTIAENPVPVAIIAVGLGYLIYCDSQRRKYEGRRYISQATDRPSGREPGRRPPDIKARAAQSTTTQRSPVNPPGKAPRKQ